MCVCIEKHKKRKAEMITSFNKIIENIKSNNYGL